MEAKINIISEACKPNNFNDCYMNDHIFCTGIREEITEITNNKKSKTHDKLSILVNSYICGILAQKFTKKIGNRYCAIIPDNINFIKLLMKKYGDLLDDNSFLVCLESYEYFKILDYNFLLHSNIDINVFLYTIVNTDMSNMSNISKILNMFVNDYYTNPEIINKTPIHTNILNKIILNNNFTLANILLNNKSLSDNTTIYYCLATGFKLNPQKKQYEFIKSLPITKNDKKYDEKYLLYYSCLILDLQFIEHFLDTGIIPDKTAYRIVLCSPIDSYIDTRLSAIKLLLNKGYILTISDIYAAIMINDDIVISMLNLVKNIKTTNKMINYACYYGIKLANFKKLLKHCETLKLTLTQQNLYYAIMNPKNNKKLIDLLITKGLIIDDECIFLLANKYDPKYVKLHTSNKQKMPTIILPHINIYFCCIHNADYPELTIYDKIDVLSDDDEPIN